MALVLLLVGLPVVLTTAFVPSGFTTWAGHLPVHPQESEGIDSSDSDSPDTNSSDTDLTGGDTGGSGHDTDPTGRDTRALSDTVFSLLTWRNAAMGGVLAFALWGVVAAAWLTLGAREGGAPAREGPPGIAVLSFVNRSADESDEFFTDGLHDELLTQLSKISGIRVISRTSVMSYRDPEIGIPRIAGELGVEYVLEGGLQRAGNQVRLNVQLIEGATDTHVWAGGYV